MSLSDLNQAFHSWNWNGARFSLQPSSWFPCDKVCACHRHYFRLNGRPWKVGEQFQPWILTFLLIQTEWESRNQNTRYFIITKVCGNQLLNELFLVETRKGDKMIIFCLNMRKNNWQGPRSLRSRGTIKKTLSEKINVNIVLEFETKLVFDCSRFGLGDVFHIDFKERLAESTEDDKFVSINNLRFLNIQLYYSLN